MKSMRVVSKSTVDLHLSDNVFEMFLFLGSLNIVLGDDFVELVTAADIDKDAIIICHCARGRRAESAREALISAGYQNVINGENAQRINEAFSG
jgi:rhodanese-related sulfurtransferase